MSSTPKRKPSKRTSSPGGAPLSSKKKKGSTPPVVSEQESQDNGASAEATPIEVPVEKIPVFKDANFVHSSKGAAGNKKTRVWKSLKQIVAAEKQMVTNYTLYSSIEAPPSLKPAKKYSDITGLPARYTDPQTKLRYSTPDEYTRIRMLPQDIVAGLLTLRKANTPVP